MDLSVKVNNDPSIVLWDQQTFEIQPTPSVLIDTSKESQVKLGKTSIIYNNKNNRYYLSNGEKEGITFKNMGNIPYSGDYGFIQLIRDFRITYHNSITNDILNTINILNSNVNDVTDEQNTNDPLYPFIRTLPTGAKDAEDQLNDPNDSNDELKLGTKKIKGMLFITWYFAHLTSRCREIKCNLTIMRRIRRHEGS